MSETMWIFVSVLVALAAALLYVNLSAGEKRVSHEIPHLYPVDDPQVTTTPPRRATKTETPKVARPT